jgi:hypothetical protein
LDDGAAVGISMGLAELIVREGGIALEQEGLDLVVQTRSIISSWVRTG